MSYHLASDASKQCPFEENSRLNDVCFLEFPKQFLAYSHSDELAAEKIFHLVFNPGYLTIGNTGIVACRELCRENRRCEGAVAIWRKGLCFQRLYRTDEEKAPVNRCGLSEDFWFL